MQKELEEDISEKLEKFQFCISVPLIIDNMKEKLKEESDRKSLIWTEIAFLADYC